MMRDRRTPPPRSVVLYAAVGTLAAIAVNLLLPALGVPWGESTAQSVVVPVGIFLAGTITMLVADRHRRSGREEDNSR